MHSRTAWTLAIVFVSTLFVVVAPTAGQTTYANQDELVLPDFNTDVPRYCLLNFPAGDGKQQAVLIVADGDRLYIDKNSDGDLTNDGECVLSTRKDWESDRDHLFTIDEIRTGDCIHKGLQIKICPLDKYDRDDQKIKDVLKVEPNADCYSLWVEIQDDRIQGRESDGRVPVFAEIHQNVDGVLQFGKSLGTAPTINWCGDLEIRLSAETNLRPGEETDIRTVVGTPGNGPGTFASIGYENVIPGFIHPRMTLRVKVAEQGKMETTTSELSHRGGETWLHGLVRVPENAQEGKAEIALEFDDWIAGAVFPSKTIVDILPAIPLVERRPVSNRVGQRLIHSDGASIVSRVVFSPNGSRVIGSTYPNNIIQIWDTGTGQQLVTIATLSGPRGDYFKPDREFSKLYASVQTFGQTEEVQVDGQAATKAAYPDSGILVLDISTGKLIEKIQTNPPNQVNLLSITPGRTHLISWESLPGTFVGKRPQISRMMNLETGEWTVLREDVIFPTVDNAEKRAVSLFTDETGMYVTGFSVMEFPSFKQLRRLDLPPGVHGEVYVHFTDDNEHLIVDFRTYDRKGIWNKWKTTIACFELETGQQVGQYRFPFDNDAPQFAESPLFGETIVLNTWRASPKKTIALQLPGLEPKWEMELGDYAAASAVVSPDGQWTAILCRARLPARKKPIDNPEDWNHVPQSELKIIGADGSLLETMVLPDGAKSLVISDDGKSAALGALGSVYMIDLSRPFENEKE